MPKHRTGLDGHATCVFCAAKDVSCGILHYLSISGGLVDVVWCLEGCGSKVGSAAVSYLTAGHVT